MSTSFPCPTCHFWAPVPEKVQKTGIPVTHRICKNPVVVEQSIFAGNNSSYEMARSYAGTFRRPLRTMPDFGCNRWTEIKTRFSTQFKKTTETTGLEECRS